MKEFVDFVEPFIYGLAVGYIWNPIWQVLKKIWSEAKKARKEW